MADRMIEIYDDENPVSPDWAHMAAREIFNDLIDRRGIKDALRGVDDQGVRNEIVDQAAFFIRAYAKTECQEKGSIP